MDIGKLFGIIIFAIFVNNFIFARFLGLCSFVGVSKKYDSSVGMGMAVTFVMTMASAVTWVVSEFLLKPYHIEYLTTIAFILVVASLVQFVEMVIQKTNPSLYRMLGIFLPLITTNCAVLGVTLINLQEKYTFIEATVNGFASAIGFTLALLLLAGIREKLEYADIPKPMQGIAITFIVSGLLAMAFMGFSGMRM